MNCQFSFGPNRSYFCSAGTVYAWSPKNLPPPLARLLEDNAHPQAIDIPYDVAFPMEPGLYALCWKTRTGEDWFEDGRLGPRYHRLARFVKNVSTKGPGLHTTLTVFGPNSSFFSHSPTGYCWQNIPPELEDDIHGAMKLRRPTCVALGVQGAYIVLYNDGTIVFDLRGQYPLVEKIIRNPQEAARRRGVMYIALNPFIPGEFYAVYGDASASWNFPTAWSADVTAISREIKPMPVAVVPAPTPPKPLPTSPPAVEVSLGGTGPPSVSSGSVGRPPSTISTMSAGRPPSTISMNGGRPPSTISMGGTSVAPAATPVQAQTVASTLAQMVASTATPTQTSSLSLAQMPSPSPVAHAPTPPPSQQPMALAQMPTPSPTPAQTQAQAQAHHIQHQGANTQQPIPTMHTGQTNSSMPNDSPSVSHAQMPTAAPTAGHPQIQNPSANIQQPAPSMPTGESVSSIPNHFASPSQDGLAPQPSAAMPLQPTFTGGGGIPTANAVSSMSQPQTYASHPTPGPIQPTFTGGSISSLPSQSVSSVSSAASGSVGGHAVPSQPAPVQTTFTGGSVSSAMNHIAQSLHGQSTPPPIQPTFTGGSMSSMNSHVASPSPAPIQPTYTGGTGTLSGVASSVSNVVSAGVHSVSSAASNPVSAGIHSVGHAVSASFDSLEAHIANNGNGDSPPPAYAPIQEATTMSAGVGPIVASPVQMNYIPQQPAYVPVGHAVSASSASSQTPPQTYSANFHPQPPQSYATIGNNMHPLPRPPIHHAHTQPVSASPHPLPSPPAASNKLTWQEGLALGLKAASGVNKIVGAFTDNNTPNYGGSDSGNVMTMGLQAASGLGKIVGAIGNSANNNNNNAVAQYQQYQNTQNQGFDLSGLGTVLDQVVMQETMYDGSGGGVLVQETDTVYDFSDGNGNEIVVEVDTTTTIAY